MPGIYLDYNATTPVDPHVLDAMLPYLRGEFGNPSSAYGLGRRAHAAIAQARAEVAALIGADAEEIFFTGGATEATNIAIRGAARLSPHRAAIVTTGIEHPATEACCRLLEQSGHDVVRVPAQPDGIVSAERMAAAITARTALATVIHAQNEIGTLQPVAAIAGAAHAAGALMHVDAAQSVGKMPVNVDALGADLLTVAGHKLYAPKGVGALYVRRGLRLPPVIVGAGQEHGLRPGTENVAFIVGLGAACALARRELDAARRRMAELCTVLLQILQREVPGLELVGDRERRLPNTLNVLFPGVSGRDVLEACPEVLASTGSACHAGCEDPSAILTALGISPAKALGAVRLSLGRATIAVEVERAASALGRAWRQVRAAGRDISNNQLVPQIQIERRPQEIASMTAQNVKLTSLAHGGGCGCKIAPAVLQQFLADQPAVAPFKELLVGTETADDAAVWQLDDDTCIIATTDFFMPMVDDPFDFGRIAATNAISDVYAMGGKPILALAIVGMPVDKIPVEMVREILKGGASVAAGAGFPIAGGHSIDCPEPVYGLAVIGTCRPEHVRRNADARAGDALILTKPIGVGIYSAAIKRGALPADGYAEMIATTTLLNRIGAELSKDLDVHAITDVTGFGVLGHALEMARGSKLAIEIEADAIPLLSRAAELAREGFVTGASHRNWASYGTDVALPAGLPDWRRHLLTDPQTSGGLLVACTPERAQAIADHIRDAGYASAHVIGRAQAGAPGVRIVA